ncbi:MAG: bile acid:sodium symporter [Pirellulales bacterium]
MFWFYPHIEYPLAATQLILAMSGMGATLTLHQFRAILRRPHPVALVLVLQYVVFPMLAAVAARVTGMPPGIAVGLVLMNTVPSGSFTNVFTYLGHGNVTLSIVMTCASTAVCFVTTPLVIDLLTTAELPGDFRIPVDKTLYPVLWFLVLPMIAGMLIARYWSKHKHAFAKWAVRASLVPLTMIVVGALGSGRIDVTEYGLGVPVLLVVFVYASLLLTKWLALLLGYNWSDAFTMGIEVAVRNGNLAIALVASLFPATEKDDPIGRGVFFVTLFYAGASMVIAAVSVTWRRILLARHERATRDESQPEPIVSPTSRQQVGRATK